jgi:hypothetical protein
MALGDMLRTDGLLQAMQPAIEKALAPMWEQTRGMLLERIAGPAPDSFARRVRILFSLTEKEVELLWQSAVLSASEMTGEAIAP